MPIQKWEYAVLDTDIMPVPPDHNDTALNRYGEQGYELVTAVQKEPANPGSNRFVFFFKRPVGPQTI